MLLEKYAWVKMKEIQTCSQKKRKIEQHFSLNLFTLLKGNFPETETSEILYFAHNRFETI